MKWDAALIPLLVAFAQAAVFLMLPGHNDRYLFWVPVDAAYRQSAQARRMLSRFRLGILALAVAAGAAGIFALLRQSAPLIIAASIGQIVASLALYGWAKSRVVASDGGHRSPDVRRATLIHEPLLPPAAWLLFAAPVLILAGTALFLDLNWDRIPDRFPVHWGIDGKPDRWAVKSFKGVYGILLIGVSTLVLLYGAAAMIVLGSPRGTGPASAANRLLRAAALSMAGAGVFVSVLFSAIALHPLAASPGKMSSPLWIVLTAIAGGTALTIWMFRLTSDAMEETGPAPARGWKCMDLVYYNRDDPAMMVPRKIGAGFTPNFAHPIVKFAMPLLLLQMVAVIRYAAG